MDPLARAQGLSYSTDSNVNLTTDPHKGANTDITITLNPLTCPAKNSASP